MAIHRRFIKRDPEFSRKCEELRMMVDTINRQADITMRGETFKPLDKTCVFTFKHNGIEIGYKLEDLGVVMNRKVFVKFDGYKLNEIPYQQRDPIMASVMDVFLVQGQGIPSIDIIDNDQCVMLQQAFLPFFLVKDENIRYGKGKQTPLEVI